MTATAADLSSTLKNMQIAVTAIVYAPGEASSPQSRETLATGKSGLQNELAEQLKFAESESQRGVRFLLKWALSRG
jgi:hypothetical protein